jgi:hypothetical protein
MSKIPTIAGLLILLGISYFGYKYLISPKTTTNLEEQTGTNLFESSVNQGSSNVLADNEAEAVKNVVRIFIDGLINSTPPKSDTKALEKAFLELSDTGKSKVPKAGNRYQLGEFLAIENAPSAGYEISNVQNLNGTVEVTVTFKYSPINLVRVLILTKTNGVWMIDGVKTIL